jgi:hypothetical protein
MMEVSIIIPTFNNANTLGTALQSVVDQNFQNWEVIIVAHIELFLRTFEAQTRAAGLATEARTLLELAIIQGVPEQRPLTIGHTHAISLEVTRPITDVSLPPGTERLHCTCLLEGEALGSVTLDATGDTISAAAIAEAIAAAYALPILGRYIEYTLYPHLKVKRQKDGLSIWRGNLCLAAGLSDVANYGSVHDEIGWELFLQEIWPRPWWRQSVIYNGQAARELMPTFNQSGKDLVMEVSQPLLNLVTDEKEIVVTILVGGAVLEQMEMGMNNGRITAHELRTAITTFAGLDLCRLAVSVGLIGHDLTNLPPLPLQLAYAAQQRSPDTNFSKAGLAGRLAHVIERIRQKLR